MSSTAFSFRLTEGPILSDWARARVLGTDAGCVIEFRGVVREQARGQSVLRLEYSAYPRMVETELASIASEMFAQFGVLRIAVEHSIGTVPVGDCSVVVAIAGAHRLEAFLASTAFMDALKERVPIWKKECYADGSIWKGQGS
ncbi:MAG: molybdenum cofactor biosynthesis protein MoaE [Planctomycetes bacterium]|nr:molybdenum cofactor biosynthesis protein MoaE [Planctomycetota bacterium]MBT4028491.1 molybdenum cofactor biosynthesis protein MoaE [Planctomycetota bacterium]MBT4559383.1 molybdenum cofactor biosynthesis protein MoaE [Planctomycetota bacterium]MBT5102272.1 molybdenum cofactor biosynthesis protein MoaE [Planctomycetota bacterium]MBT5119806.1 molybdenum cofactor biosynthesis protein MoaE [Planctomycetota bacterium]